MKKSLLGLLIAILTLAGCKEQAPETISDDGFVVIGTTDSLLNNASLSVMMDGREEPVGTVHVKDCKFWYESDAENLTIYQVSRSMAQSDPAKQMFFAQNGDSVHIHLSSQMGLSRVSGTTVNDDFQMTIDSAMNRNKRLEKEFAKYGDNPSEAQKKEMKKLMKEENDRLAEIYYKVAEKHIDNEFGFFITTILEDFSDEQRMALIKKMPQHFRERDVIKDLEKAISSTGKKFPQYTIRDIDGSFISLTDEIKKHKLTIIDFWASWCAPCMQVMPHMVQLYGKYKDKGLGMIGVSLDKDEESWKRAVSDFNANWTQTSELNGWDCKLVKDLGFTAIPHTVIVDSEGTIVAQGLTGLKLEEFLQYMELDE